MEPLRMPTDGLILDFMRDEKRQTSPHLAQILDKDRRYIASRLKALRDHGFLEDPAREDYSTRMNVITEEGLQALWHIERYRREYTDVFAEVMENQVKYENGELGSGDEDIIKSFTDVVSDIETDTIRVETVKSILEEKYPEKEYTEQEIRENLYRLYVVGNVSQSFGQGEYAYKKPSEQERSGLEKEK